MYAASRHLFTGISVFGWEVVLYFVSGANISHASPPGFGHGRRHDINVCVRVDAFDLLRLFYGFPI